MKYRALIEIIVILGLLVMGNTCTPDIDSDDTLDELDCTLTVKPKKPEVRAGESRQFIAKDGGKKVRWRFVENQSGGTLDKNGLYTAGAVIGAVDEIEAEGKSYCGPGNAKIKVICPLVIIDGPANVKNGYVENYFASGGIPPYTWSVDPPESATIDENTGELTAIATGEVSITVTDSSGCSGTMPVVIMECVNIFFDDFDNEMQGNFTGDWASCSQPDTLSCATQDDWQIGDPDGDCGDPNTAYSGANVLGNDIGNTGWNGCYGGNVINYIVSPVIDATSYSELEIYFQMWVTVNNNDFAEFYIKCGSSDWILLLSHDNYDNTAWEEVSLLPPEGLCDHEPSIEFRFLLDTTRYTHAGGWNIDDFEVCGYILP